LLYPTELQARRSIFATSGAGVNCYDPKYNRIAMSRDPTCPRCSKPILPATGRAVAGRLIHVRCLVHATRIEAVEQAGRASRDRERAAALMARAAKAVARARVNHRLCSVCGRSLRAGGAAVSRGDARVHPACARVTPEAPAPEPAP